jgi:hypothetical protein
MDFCLILPFFGKKFFGGSFLRFFEIARNAASEFLGTKPSFYKETALKPGQLVSKAQSKKLAKSRLQFPSRRF